MKTKFQFQFLVLLILLFGACHDDDTNVAEYNPAIPVKITGFSPDSGGIRSRFVIQGENFGTDPEKINVYFGKQKASVIASSGNSLYAIVPKCTNLDNLPISMKVGDDSVVYEDKTFHYLTAANVSTIVGMKQANPVDNFGPFATTSFKWEKKETFLMIDDENNIFVIDRGWKVVLVSEAKQESSYFHGVTNVPCMDPSTNIMYFMTTMSPASVSKRDPMKQWAEEPTYISTAGAGSKDGFIRTMVADGKGNIYINQVSDDKKFTIIQKCKIATGEKKKIFSETDNTAMFGTIRNNYLCMALNPKDNKLYAAPSGLHGIIRMNLDGTEQELFAGNIDVAGMKNGPALQARFNKIYQICFDEDGNLFVADRDNHAIRKISADGIVSTFAGKLGEAGYQNGAPEKSLFNMPTGVAIDANGFLVVADFQNYMVRRVAVE